MAEKNSKKETSEKPRCGIIMPISEIDGCSPEHWADVKDVLLEVIGQTEFEGDLVSNAGEIRIIHETIVQNIYNNEMIICDVSGKNPNVMFELGLRLAFDKAAIIIKDDMTNYSFDTSPIEHLEYPRDLNYKKINDFKILLKEKLIVTYKKAKVDNKYSPFLKSFGQFKVASLETKEVSSEAYIIKELDEIKEAVWKLSGLVEKESGTSKSSSIQHSKVTGVIFQIESTEISKIIVKEFKNKVEVPFSYNVIEEKRPTLVVTFENPLSYTTVSKFVNYLSTVVSIKQVTYINEFFSVNRPPVTLAA